MFILWFNQRIPMALDIQFHSAAHSSLCCEEQMLPGSKLQETEPLQYF